MGWTWNGKSAIALLNKYPSIAEVPQFVNLWPGLKEELKSPQAAELKVEVREALKLSLPDVEIAEPR